MVRVHFEKFEITNFKIHEKFQKFLAIFCATLSLSWAKPQNCNNNSGCSAGRGNYNQAVGGSETWLGSSGPVYQTRCVTFILTYDF